MSDKRARPAITVDTRPDPIEYEPVTYASELGRLLKEQIERGRILLRDGEQITDEDYQPVPGTREQTE